jgi:dihydrolipoamide dehydrogenase
MSKPRIIVIGAGPAGYAAAIRASQLGGDVLVIEKNRVGGTCLNRGCIPTKALLSITSTLRRVRQLKKKGVLMGDVGIDFDKVFASRDEAVSRLVRGVEYLLRKNNVQLVRGEAKIIDRNVVEVSGERFKYDKLIIATGSQPLKLSIPSIENVNAVSGDEFVVMNEIPNRLLIIGGGAIGTELAQVFKTLGSDVHVVELMPHILPNMDSEIALSLQKILSRDNIKIYTNTSVNKFERSDEGIVAHLSNGNKLVVDRVVIAVGRKPNTKDLGLHILGIKVGERGEIVVNENMETNVLGIYAAGDVVGRHFLAYTAFEEGVVAAENALGLNTKINYKAIPIAIFTDPEVASVGMTEEEAKKMLGDVIVCKFPLAANGRAITLDSYEGFVKLIASKNGKLLGVHIIGPEASEIIHIASIIIGSNGNVNDLLNTLYVHPTISESIKDATLALLKKPIHI